MVSAAVSLQFSAVRSIRPDRIALSLLGFAVALTAFLLGPPFLREDVGSVPAFTGQEAADLLTPLVAMPLLALAIEYTGYTGLRARVVFVLLVAAWVAGQGIHLAANAIGDAFPVGAARDTFYGTTAGTLDHFLDEDLSHWLWHVAWVGLLLVLLWAAAAGPGADARPSRSTLAIAGLAGVLHGFTWFVVSDEGGTWGLAIPATAVLLVAGWLVRGRDQARVITTFLVIGALLTLALYAIWVAAYGWPPKPICEVLGC